ncbi:MAG: ABC transporter permease subunit, partial [Terracoccus sp.]
MRLLRVEIQRYFSRRLTKLTALAVLALVALILLGVQQDAYNSVPSRRDQIAQDQVQQCESAQQQARAGDPGADFHCAGITNEAISPPIASFAAAAADRSANLALLFGAAGFFIGAAFFAGEFATGSMGTWLTFEPRRRRVYASKLAAAALGSVLLTAVWMAALLVGIYLVLRLNGLSTDLTGAERTDLVWMVVRVLVVCAGAAAGGAVLGTLLRHTAAALGVMLGYAILVEAVLAQLITSVVPEPQPWLVYSNFQAFVQNGWSYLFNPCVGAGGGGSCEPAQHTISLGHSSIYLAVLV